MWGEVRRCQKAKGFVRQEEDSGFSPGGSRKLWKGSANMPNMRAWLVKAEQ